MNEQEEFWMSDFGNHYIERNISDKLFSSNLNLFSRILNSLGALESVLELGCNVGMNLRALKYLNKDLNLYGIDINKKAIAELNDSDPDINAETGSILDPVNHICDLTFTKGVLIHIHPDNLEKAYENLYTNAKKYILIAEYYNPSPVTLAYRGHENKLFKRDFCKDMMDRYRDLTLADYGFSYRHDPIFPQDDITWFLMKK